MKLIILCALGLTVGKILGICHMIYLEWRDNRSTSNS